MQAFICYYNGNQYINKHVPKSFMHVHLNIEFQDNLLDMSIPPQGTF